MSAPAFVDSSGQTHTLISLLESALMDPAVDIGERRALCREIEGLAVATDMFLEKEQLKDAADWKEHLRETSDSARNR